MVGRKVINKLFIQQFGQRYPYFLLKEENFMRVRAFE